jgi:hypothetical protein
MDNTINNRPNNITDNYKELGYKPTGSFFH